MYSFNGYNATHLTFAVSGDITPNHPVKLSDSEVVSVAAKNDAFCGVATTVRNGAASVQLGGYIELPFTGTARAVGKSTLAADGNGGVTVSENGTQALIIKIDTANKICGFIF